MVCGLGRANLIFKNPRERGREREREREREGGREGGRAIMHPLGLRVHLPDVSIDELIERPHGAWGHQTETVGFLVHIPLNANGHG
jgi:hypothetical protein